MKKIIEYYFGCKGDFLANFLEGNNQIGTHGASHCPDAILKNATWSSYSGNVVDEPDLLLGLQKSELSFLPSHATKFLPDSIKRFLNEHYKVYKLNYTPEFEKTIVIEGNVKQLTRTITPDIAKQYLNVSPEDCQLEYWIDFFLYSNKIEINNQNRIDRLTFIMKNPHGLFPMPYFKQVEEAGVPNTTVVQYQDLYVDFNLNSELFDGVDLEQYKQQVSSTWLPDEINIFGTKIYPREFGYLDF